MDNQEPCGWVNEYGVFSKQLPNDVVYSWKPVYPAPPKKEFVCSTGLCHYKHWVGLTDDELEKIDCVQLKYIGTGEYSIEGVDEFARAIEAKLREKNGF